MRAVNAPEPASRADVARRFTIPFPDEPFYRGRNKQATPEQWDRFRQSVRECAELAGINRVGQDEVVLTLRFFTQHRKHDWDLDRLVNAVLDSLQGVIYTNDRQVIELHAFVRRHAADTRIEVEYATASDQTSAEYVAMIIRGSDRSIAEEQVPKFMEALRKAAQGKSSEPR